MRICIISKYPPIEGGVSAENYWLSKALGKRGHQIHIVTNASEVEPDYREDISADEVDRLEPKNVRVHNTQPLKHRLIPRYEPFIVKLAGLAIKVIERNNIDLIYSQYLLPYGIAAYLAKQATKKPLFVSHAGSDITKLFDSPFFGVVFKEVFKGADKIRDSRLVRTKIVNKGTVSHDKLISVGMKQFIDPEEFHPGVEPFDISSYIPKEKRNFPVLTYLGKVSKLKKIFEFVSAAASIKKEEFILLFVVGENKRSLELKDYINSVGLMNKTVFLKFQPPWKIPAIINASTCIVAPESYETPFLPKGTHYPRIAREALACGKCTIIGTGMAEKGIYRRLQDGVNILIVDPDNVKEFSQRLKLVITNPSLVRRIGQEARRFWRNETRLYEKSIDEIVTAFRITIFQSLETA